MPAAARWAAAWFPPARARRGRCGCSRCIRHTERHTTERPSRKLRPARSAACLPLQSAQRDRCLHRPRRARSLRCRWCSLQRRLPEFREVPRSWGWPVPSGPAHLHSRRWRDDSVHIRRGRPCLRRLRWPQFCFRLRKPRCPHGPVCFHIRR